MNKEDAKKLAKMFLTFFKIGLFTIGGGLVMLPVMQNEFVEKQKWVGEEKLNDIFAVVQALPGVIAINSSIYMGYEIYGLLGAVIACIGIVLPSFLVILLIYFTLSGFTDSIILTKFYTGVRAAVVALVAMAAIKLAKTSVKDYFGIAVAVFGIIATMFLRLNIVYIVLISGISAYIYYSLVKGSLYN